MKMPKDETAFVGGANLVGTGTRAYCKKVQYDSYCMGVKGGKGSNHCADA
jgi:hypothetical protein